MGACPHSEARVSRTSIEKKQSEFEMDVCIRTYSVARESQTSTEMEQSEIEVGVRAMKKKRGARLLLAAI